MRRQAGSTRAAPTMAVTVLRSRPETSASWRSEAPARYATYATRIMSSRMRASLVPRSALSPTTTSAAPSSPVSLPRTRIVMKWARRRLANDVACRRRSVKPSNRLGLEVGVCGRGTRSRTLRRHALCLRRPRRRRCRPRVLSVRRRNLRPRASSASPHGAARRRFNQSTNRCPEGLRAERSCRWRYRRIAANRPGVARGGSPPTPPSCRRTS